MAVARVAAVRGEVAVVARALLLLGLVAAVVEVGLAFIEGAVEAVVRLVSIAVVVDRDRTSALPVVETVGRGCAVMWGRGMPGLRGVAARTSGRRPASIPATSGATVAGWYGAACRSGSTAAITTAIAIGFTIAPSRQAVPTGGIATIHAGTGTGDRWSSSDGFREGGRPGRPFAFRWRGDPSLQGNSTDFVLENIGPEGDAVLGIGRPRKFDRLIGSSHSSGDGGIS